MFDRSNDAARYARLKLLEEKLEKVHKRDLECADAAIEAAQDLNRKIESRRLDPGKLYLKIEDAEKDKVEATRGSIFVRIQQQHECLEACLECRRRTA